MLPTKQDINIHDSLDERTAAEHFLNKTLAQAEAMFLENSLEYQEDLMWMGPKALGFYLPAVLGYLQSDASTGDAQLISSLEAMLEFRLEQEGISVAAGPARELVDYVISHYEKFEVDPGVYSDLLKSYRQLKARLQGL